MLGRIVRWGPVTSGVDGRRRVVLENVEPQVGCGRFPIKRVVGEAVVVWADIFSDGHEAVSARLLYREDGGSRWGAAEMCPLVNDRWVGEFVVRRLGVYRYMVLGWVDEFRIWQRKLQNKLEAGQSVEADLRLGVGCVGEPALYELDFDSKGCGWIDYSDWEQSVISFVSKEESTGDLILVVCNFTPVPRKNHRAGDPRGGFWRGRLNSDVKECGGSGHGNLGGVEATPVGYQGIEHSLSLVLPPLGVVFLKSEAA